MKLPFVIDKEDFRFEPHKQWAQRSDIDPVQKEILHAMDVFEQVQNKLVAEAITNRTLIILVCLAIGPQLILLWQRFFGE